MDSRYYENLLKNKKRSKFRWLRLLIMWIALISIGIGIGVFISPHQTYFSDELNPGRIFFNYNVKIPSTKGDKKYVRCECQCPGDNVITSKKKK